MTKVIRTWYSDLFPFPTFRRFVADQCISWFSFLVFWGIILALGFLAFLIFIFGLGHIMPEVFFRNRQNEIVETTGQYMIAGLLGFSIIYLTVFFGGLGFTGLYYWDYLPWCDEQRRRNRTYDFELLPPMRDEAKRWSDIADWLFTSGSLAKYFARTGSYLGVFLLWAWISGRLLWWYFPDTRVNMPLPVASYLGMCIQLVIILVVTGVTYYFYLEYDKYIELQKRKIA